MNLRKIRRRLKRRFRRMTRRTSGSGIGRKLAQLPGRLVRRTADLVWPRKCVVCRRILEEEPGCLCSACLRQMPAPQNDGKRGEHYSQCVSVCSYEGAWRDSLRRFKFNGRRMYAKTYGPLLAEVIRRELAGQYDRITWVPLSPKRLRTRGYDQSKLLACSAAKELGGAAVCLLKRRRSSDPLSTMGGRAERRANILGRFEASDPAAVRGRRILLIDDILTTGATLSEASRVLLQAGAASVVCATFAKTPHHITKEP